MKRKRERLTDKDDAIEPNRKRGKANGNGKKVKELVPAQAQRVAFSAEATKSRISKSCAEAIWLALEMHGDDGRGKNGIPGYFYYLARTDPKAMAHLVGRMLPQKVQASVDPQSTLGQFLEAVRAKIAIERSKQINGTVISAKPN